MRLGTGALIGAFGFALATTGISAAQAYTLSYSIDLPTSSATQILVVQQGYDYHFGLEFYRPNWSAGPGNTVISPSLDLHAPLQATSLVGLTQDAQGAEHIVLFADDDWAASAVGEAWSDLFPDIDEAALIASIEQTSGAWTDYQIFVDFALEYNREFGFAPADTFTAISFSNGAIIGSGISYLTPIPEASTWVMLLAGFGGVGLASVLRRREAATRRA